VALDPPPVCDVAGNCTDEPAFPVLVDRQAPSISSPNDGQTYAAGDPIVAAVQCTDAGSGVATEGVTFDGAASTQGAVLDMFLLAPGTHTVVVQAADRLGNASSATRTFKVQATSESLVANVKRACAEGIFQGEGLCTALLAKVEHAAREHSQGSHAVEHNDLAAWINQLEAQRGKKADEPTANRFIAYATDLIARKA